jgi:hypothetical protein
VSTREITVFARSFDRKAGCPLCCGFIDVRDRVWLEEHQQSLPHPPQKGRKYSL